MLISSIAVNELVPCNMNGSDRKSAINGMIYTAPVGPHACWARDHESRHHLAFESEDAVVVSCKSGW